MHTLPSSIWALPRKVLRVAHEGASNCGIVPSSRTFVMWCMGSRRGPHEPDEHRDAIQGIVRQGRAGLAAGAAEPDPK